jgi:hypothetical protein
VMDMDGRRIDKVLVNRTQAPKAPKAPKAP